MKAQRKTVLLTTVCLTPIGTEWDGRDHELCLGAQVYIPKNRVLGTLRVLPMFYFKIHETTYGIWVLGKGDDKINYSCPIQSPQSQTSLALESLETDGDILSSRETCTWEYLLCHHTTGVGRNHTNRTPSLRRSAWAGKREFQVEWQEPAWGWSSQARERDFGTNGE